LLAEVHALLGEAEAWVSSERDGTDLAEQALARCRDAVGCGAGGVVDVDAEAAAQ